MTVILAVPPCRVCGCRRESWLRKVRGVGWLCVFCNLRVVSVAEGLLTETEAFGASREPRELLALPPGRAEATA